MSPINLVLSSIIALMSPVMSPINSMLAPIMAPMAPINMRLAPIVAPMERYRNDKRNDSERYGTIRKYAREASDTKVDIV